MTSKNWIGLLIAGIFVASCGHATKDASTQSIAPLKDEIAEEQAFTRAAELYKAVGKNVDGQKLRVSLVGKTGQRYWRVYPQGEGTASPLSFDSKTGLLRDFIDKDPTDHRSGQSRSKPGRLSESELESKLKWFLKQAGFEQSFTQPRFEGEPTKDDVYTEIYEIHNGLPVRDNVIEIGLRASDGSIFYAGAGFSVSTFAGTVKIEANVANIKAQAVQTSSKESMKIRLWYARLQDSKKAGEYVSQTARPYYIAEYGNGAETWIDAETGQVFRSGRDKAGPTINPPR